MKKIIVRIVSVLAVAAMLTALALPAAAETKKPEFMLAIGDSITTGFGLDGYVDADPYTCESYTNIVARALGLEAKSTYLNKAVNGATSSDLLALLPEIKNYLGYSDLIVVTVGGNDLLGAVPLVASAISGKTVTSLAACVDVLSAATPAQFAALANNQNFQTQMLSVLTRFSNDLASSAALIKQHAPNARVIFLKQYNPMKNVLGFVEFGNFADTLIGAINNSIEQVCTASGFEVLDVPSVIDVNAPALTNMLNYDIHPNAAGHLEIAKLLASHLGVSLDSSADTTATPDETTNAPEVTTKAPEETTKAPEETTKAPEETTKAPEETTNVPEADTGNGEGDATLDSEPEVKKGCFSSVSAGAVILVSLCSLAVIKKKN